MTYIYRVDYMGGQCHSFPKDENDQIGWLEVLQGEGITEIHKVWAHGPRERVTDQYKWIIEGCNSRKPSGPPKVPTMLTIRAAADKTGLSYDFIRKLCAQVVLDALDMDETQQALSAASALSRQIWEEVVSEVDTYTLGVICAGAGTKPAAAALTKENIYQEIIKGGLELDNAEVPEDGRVLIVTPATYYLMKQCKDIVMETDIGSDMRVRGVVSNLDGMTVAKVPANRLPAGFGFLIAHPCATAAPMKLESYRTHQDPPGISGVLCEGRVVYDAFVLENKKKAIYYHAQPVA